MPATSKPSLTLRDWHADFHVYRCHTHTYLYRHTHTTYHIIIHTHIYGIWPLRVCCIFSSFHVWHLSHMLGKAAIVAFDIEGGTEQVQARRGVTTDPNVSENGRWDRDGAPISSNFQFSFGKCDFKPFKLYSIFRIWKFGATFSVSAGYFPLIFQPSVEPAKLFFYTTLT